MIIEHKDNLAAFRAAVREWVRETAPPEKAHLWRNAKVEDLVEIQKWWMAERNKVGLATPHWPSEYGGADLGVEHQIIIADEFAQANAPGSESFVIGLNHIPGTLIPFGSERQKTKYLPTVAKGTIWCQGFSEPGAGSDLANLSTRAVRDGDHYVINGQKIWSSYSMFASYAILLARTDFDGATKKQRGLSYFVLDMAAPGVEVRPIRKSTGASMFAEMFLTDVRIPVEDRVGEENQGWTVAQATLSSERGVLAFEFLEREHAFVREFYANELANGAAWLADDELRRDFMRLFGELQALRRQVRRLLKEPRHAGQWAMTPSLVKLARSELLQRFGALRLGLEGYQSQIVLSNGPRRAAMYDYLDSYGSTIAGGSNEVMRNLIAERGLNMPRI
ncbi:acyl-CoA dehydrogenase family protein [Phenylobacterium sp.]|uniref:acyl-CoA dehydrogenase family protein n=1 Tax=Phenylobacterium sp. TaxID=1871053 RepID=UPI0028A1AB09|nr:acyl-CoA dehydrogenase family protein [Phenylobacterium sp.]